MLQMVKNIRGKYEMSSGKEAIAFLTANGWHGHTAFGGMRQLWYSEDGSLVAVLEPIEDGLYTLEIKDAE